MLHDKYSLHWRPLLNKIMLLLLVLSATFAIGYFLYQMPKLNKLQPRVQEPAAIRLTSDQFYKQMDVIQYMARIGVIKKFERNEKGAATLWVDTRFYLMTFQDKEKALIACATYYWATVSTLRTIVIKDWRTKKTIGHFGPSGLLIHKGLSALL